MCKQASNNVSCACTILQQRHISTCVRVARAPMFVRERRLLAAQWKSTQLWLLTGVEQYRCKGWAAAVTTWKDSRRKLVLPMRYDWKYRSTRFASIFKRGVYMN